MVQLFVSDKEKIFIFKFENRVMGGNNAKVQEISQNIYLVELEALFVEDIILDMRDKIVSHLIKASDKILFSDDFLEEIEGKMEFYVRKVSALASGAGPARNDIANVHNKDIGMENLKWIWKNVNDFDRFEKFTDDEVFEDEVVFKLVKTQGREEEILDERQLHVSEGYDNFTIYKHADSSYEWRLCKIVERELKPEFK
jgi:hypothetical protein